MIGWGAALGGVIGAAVGAGTENTKHFSDLVRDAVKSGHAVLIAHAATEQQTTTAQSVIGNSLKDPNQTGRLD
jgi:L-asparaginase/Glu-tRNA(Gln) amidotransferase subunit D